MEHSFYDPRTKREFTVHGAELVHVESTPRVDNPGRNTAIQIFKLEESGRFAVVVTGKSIVFHDGEHPCTTRHGRPKGEPVTYEQLTVDHLPCPICRPAPYGEGRAYLETNRSRITICDNSMAVRHALEGRDPHSGTTFLSGLGEEAWARFADTQGIPDTQALDIR